MKKKFECQCETCQNACEHQPGWFAPGEAEKAAKLMGLTFKDFFNKYLRVNWWVGDEKDIFVLYPNVVGGTPGTMADYNPKGKCIFFKKGLCQIHQAKPLECVQMNCKEGTDNNTERKEANVMNWQNHQSQIRELLGEEPEPADGHMWELL